MEFSEFAGLLYPIIGGGDSRSICRRDWTKNRPNDGCESTHAKMVLNMV